MRKRSSGLTIEQLNLHGGWLCLDFANTVEWRATDEPLELLTEPAALLAWGGKLGLYERWETRELFEWVGAHGADAARIWRRALVLREQIHAVFSALAKGDEPPAPELDGVWHASVDALRQAELRRGKAYEPAWPSAGLERVTFAVSVSAAELLASPELLRRVRRCPASGCGWLFLDRTKNASRRWCSMAGCGSREKMRRLYARRRGATPGRN